uniref:cysteine synthase n=1 Tax=Wollemia nobilis TaxID=56998 RepID=A0A0C9S3B9_9CONI
MTLFREKGFAAATASVSALALAIVFHFIVSAKRRGKRTRRPIPGCPPVVDGVVGAIGNTALIRIKSLSEATGCEILAKAEFMNPGGSIKDRVAAKIIQEALQSGKLVRGGVVTEGSAGSTAISLAMVAPAYGCRCHVVIPDDAAMEKAQILEALGATVERVRPVSITHKDHFVNIARRRAMEATAHANEREAQEIKRADKKEVKPCKNGDSKESCGGFNDIDDITESGSENPISGQTMIHHGGQAKENSHTSTYLCGDECKGGFFADQFENLANFRAHYEGTGPEIWEQTGGNLHAFVAAAGTGGTLAGISRFLQDKNPDIKCFLIDPPGSGLFNKVTRGVMFTREEAEGKRLKNPFDTITEGIGINRVTQNFQLARLDGAFRGTDTEAVEMSRFLLKNDGLFVGSSSAMNCVGAVRAARLLGPGNTIVTILCDSGMRHLSKFYNPQYLAAHNLAPSASGLEFLGAS